VSGIATMTPLSLIQTEALPDRLGIVCLRNMSSTDWYHQPGTLEVRCVVCKWSSIATLDRVVHRPGNQISCAFITHGRRQSVCMIAPTNAKHIVENGLSALGRPRDRFPRAVRSPTSEAGEVTERFIFQTFGSELSISTTPPLRRTGSFESAKRSSGCTELCDVSPVFWKVTLVSPIIAFTRDRPRVTITTARAHEIRL
jgi:hypothetical protein